MLGRWLLVGHCASAGNREVVWVGVGHGGGWRGEVWGGCGGWVTDRRSDGGYRGVGGWGIGFGMHAVGEGTQRVVGGPRWKARSSRSVRGSALGEAPAERARGPGLRLWN